MHSPRTSHSIKQRQHGAVLMIMLVIMVMGVVAFFVSSLSSTAIQIKRDEVTANALAQAKEALIGYAATNAALPGKLPCPENPLAIGTLNEGQEKPNCSNTLTVIGRLPWRALNLDDIRDGNGDRLWYARSAGFFGSITTPINSNTPAQLTVDGTPAVAIIFSAGPPINGQSRPLPTASSPPVVGQYLDLTNSDGDAVFTSQGPAGTFNDKLLLVSANDLFHVVEKRVIAEIRGLDDPPTSGLREFYKINHYYPCAADAVSSGSPVTTPACLTSGLVPYASLSFTTATYNWLTNNNWYSLVSYDVAPNFQQGTSYPQQCGVGGSGCLTVNNYVNSQARVTAGGSSAIVCTINGTITTCPYP